MATKTNTHTILNIKTDKTLKAEAKEVAAALGIPLGTAVNAFLKQFVRERKLELSDERDLTPTPYLERILQDSKEEYERGEFNGPYSAEEFENVLQDWVKK